MKRPAIPWRVVLAAAIRQAGGEIPCAVTGEPMTEADALAGRIERDHNPPLSQRKRDPVTGEYDPPANSPAHIDLVSQAGHKARTFERRGLQRGDLTENAHTRRLSEKHEAHRRAMLAKGDKQPRPKSSIPSRGFDKRFRRKLNGKIERRNSPKPAG